MPRDRRFAAAVSTHPDAVVATAETVGQVLEHIGDRPDLAFVAVGAEHAHAFTGISATVRRALRPGTLLGAVSTGIVGNGQEIEHGPGIAVWAGRTGPVLPVRIEGAEPADVRHLCDRAAQLPGARGVLMVTDPYSFAAERFMADLNRARPDLVTVGGLAAGAHQPGETRLLLDDAVHSDGAVAVVLGDGCELAALVSQGCRPVGQPFTVTRAESNTIHDLASTTALHRVDEVMRSLEDADARRVASYGLHLGIVIDEHKVDLERGDFLVRGVLGANRSNGAIVVGHEVPVGATVQFHVLDPIGADQDLHLQIARAASEGGADAALLFTCTGRGVRMFRSPSHDARAITSLTDVPLAGLFCGGEIGPIGGRSWVHTYTASVALLRPQTI